jgi:glycyl-tRNA synthetase
MKEEEVSQPYNAFEKIVSLCKRRGFIFQSSEIYGGVGSTWDYGPLGVELKNNVIRAWWQAVVYDRDDMEGLDAAILMNRLVWKYSGHEKTFVDPLVDCKQCKKRFRADHLSTKLEMTPSLYGSENMAHMDAAKTEASVKTAPTKCPECGGELTEPRMFNGMFTTQIGPVQSEAQAVIIRDQGIEINTKQMSYDDKNNTLLIPDTIIKLPEGSDFDFWPWTLKSYNNKGELVFEFKTNNSVETKSHLLSYQKDGNKIIIKAQTLQLNRKNIKEELHPLLRFIKVPKNLITGQTTAVPSIEVALEQYGQDEKNQIPVLIPVAISGDSNIAYLRPETAQGIFANFLNVLQSSRRKLPFGIAQVGKAFRNEITPGNFTFRTREFEQMEIEYFCKPPKYLQPGEKDDMRLLEEWIAERYNWYIKLGISPERLRKRPQAPDELAHYSKATTDLEYLFPGSLGWAEVEGVANRQDYDLTAHSKDVPQEDLDRLRLERNAHSTEKLEYFDESYIDSQTGKKGAKYIPYVIEPSAGATRATLAFLCEAYDEEQLSKPDPAALKPLRDGIEAALRNLAKRMDEESKKPRPEGPNAEQLRAIESGLKGGLAGLPDGLLDIDNACSLPGADRLDLVKKVKAVIGRLCDEHTRTVLRLHPVLAPIKVAVLPLKKNEPAIVEKARSIKQSLKSRMRAVYDDTAGIGKLYRRQDEIGTPFCVTVDFQTLQDGTVTLRHRDTMGQERLKAEGLAEAIEKRMSEWPSAG